MVKLSIIFPAYNEEKTIEKTVKSYINFLDKKIKNSYELIIIPNGCKDKTVNKVRTLSKKYKQIKYLDLGKIGDKGIAVIEGFKLATGELIGFADSDLSTSPEAFYDLVLKIKDNDGIIGSRWRKDSKINKKQPLLRIIASRGFNFLVRSILGLHFTDTQCGSKLFTKKAVKIVEPQLGITRWGFDIDVLYKMKKNRFKVIEIPTVWKDDSNSHLNMKRTIPEMFLSILRLRLLYSPFKIIVKFYDLLPDSVTFRRWIDSPRNSQ